MFKRVFAALLSGVSGVGVHVWGGVEVRSCANYRSFRTPGLPGRCSSGCREEGRIPVAVPPKPRRGSRWEHAHRLLARMKSPAHRCRDIERRAGYLGPEHCAPPPPLPQSDAMWFIRDGCGIVCGAITWLLVLYAEFVVVFVMLLPSNNVVYSVLNGVVFNGLAFLALASHFRAMCTDPGAVPKGNATKEFIESLQLKPGQVVYKCPKCCSIKPDRAHHCSVCKRCIRKMDHHCPWVNNCVGENNQKYFVLFTMYIALISLHALVMVACHFVFCFEQDWTKCSSLSPPATVILLILLCFEGLLFLIFTAVMFGTQVHSICTDETGIEQLKKEERRWVKKSRWMNMKVVFGHPFSIAWLSPFATPDHGKADPYQYVV